MHRGIFLFNMGMIADVILTVAEVTIALGAIAKLQLRIRNIRSAAKDTFMGVGRLRFLFCVDLYINGLGAAAPVPQTGNDILNIAAHKQKIVGKGHQGEQIVGEPAALI